MSNQKRALFIVISFLLLMLIPLGRLFLYTINERELAVITQFGEVVQDRTEAGLYFKIPFIQEVRRLPRTYLFWEGNEPSEKLVDLPTADGKKIEATLWFVWRINDPEAFVTTLRTMDNAENRVKQIVRGKARDVLASNDLAEIVRSTNRTMNVSLSLPESAIDMTTDEQEAAIEISPEANQEITIGRKQILEQILELAQAELTNASGSESLADDAASAGGEGRGIELVDVGLSRIEVVEDVRQAAFERLKAVMNAIAEKNRAEGEQRKQEIINQASAEAEEIRGEGSEQSNIIRGQVEAEIIRNYAQAIEDSEGFYDFNRTLELYKESLSDSGTRLILSTSSPLLRLLSEFDPDALPPPSGSPETNRGTATATRSEANSDSAPPAPPAEPTDSPDDDEAPLELPEDPFTKPEPVEGDGN